MKEFFKKLGPGLLFASSSIGTSHLVLSTRAGAHHGLIFVWIILLCLLMKYPFFEFAPRYVSATGQSLLYGYRKQGKWAIVLYIFIIFISMFAVVGAVGGVSAGILSTVFQFDLPISWVLGTVLTISAIIMIIGGYKSLDHLIKWLSVALFISVIIAFVAVLINGPVDQPNDFVGPPLLEGAGLALLISLLGWMPSGLEASTMHSFWIKEKEKTEGAKLSFHQNMLDFKLGYWFTVVIAVMFAVIGSFTVFGTGEKLEGSTTSISRQLIEIFTNNIGPWSFYIIAVAAFGTVYGTLIAAWDGFARSISRGIRSLIFENLEESDVQQDFLSRYYSWILIAIAVGGFVLFNYFSSNMIQMLEAATIFSFVAAPILAYLNLKAVTAPDIPSEYRPDRALIVLAWIGLAGMVLFAGYYIYILIVHGMPGH